MIMIEELYDALRSVNVPDDKARAAAREVAKHASGMEDLRGEMKLLRTELKGELAALRTELQGDMKALKTELDGRMTLLQWMR